MTNLAELNQRTAPATACSPAIAVQGHNLWVSTRPIFLYICDISIGSIYVYSFLMQEYAI